MPRFLVVLGRPGTGPVDPAERRLERAIGVIYMPRSERLSHYFHARLALQFDAVLHFDTTTAVEPLDHEPMWDAGEPPETFPFGV